jgi:hypothetical protein
MKTSFDTEEERYFLKTVLNRAIQSTEAVIFNTPTELNVFIAEYFLLMIELRKKCFDVLQEEDPNKNVIDLIKSNIKQLRAEQFPLQCDACGNKRPWGLVSVYSYDMCPEDPGVAYRNLRFCNDNDTCYVEVQKLKEIIE